MPGHNKGDQDARFRLGLEKSWNDLLAYGGWMDISEQSAQFILEQMSQLFDFYLDTDYDEISMEQIKGDIVYFRKILKKRWDDYDLGEVLGFVSQAIPFLQKAGNLALPEIDRDVEYYQRVEQANGFLREAQRVAETKLEEIAKGPC
jgi:hypothetical protein